MALTALVVAGPAGLFADFLPHYRLHSDDFAYVAGSRTPSRALANLFVPHNTHVVPAWRLLTGVVVAAAGSLANLPAVLAVVSYGTLVLAMLVTGRLVARETGRAIVALAAMVALGTTSLSQAAATWYSAGQTLWAALGVLGMLSGLQGWRRRGGAWRLLAAALCTVLAGWMWSVGHAAGPVGAVYLWADGRTRCRLAAVVPLLATALAAGLALGLGGSRIDATVSFHGRTSAEAFDAMAGLSHTLQAIPEDLVLGNLGLAASTTVAQGVVYSIALALLWLWSRRRSPWVEGSTGSSRVTVLYAVAVAAGFLAIAATARLRSGEAVAVGAGFAVLGMVVVSDRGSPLERAGGTLVLVSFAVEWSFRGYLPFSSLRGIVPWYDTIPHLGAVLLVAGRWSRGPGQQPGPPITPPSRAGALGIVAMQVALIVIHGPRVETILRDQAPPMSDEEARLFLIPSLQRLRALYLAEARADWQTRHLRRLDLAEPVARRLGIGRDQIGAAFGRIEIPEIPDAYDAIDLLDLPSSGPSPVDPAAIRRALGPYLSMEAEPAIPLNQVRRPSREGP